MVAGITISTNFEIAELPNLSYEAISGAVGGYIQLIHLRNDFEGYAMYLHEEGKLIGLPMNDLATAVWENSFGAYTDIILGNVVIVNAKTDGEGNELPIGKLEAETLVVKLRKLLIAYAG